MTRTPYAADTLRDQVKERWPRAKVEVIGEPDGLGVIRSLRFSKAIGPRLHEILEIINDNRIAALHLESGSLTVTFTDSARLADDRREFPLAAVADVLAGG